jgi:hypothetical protein
MRTRIQTLLLALAWTIAAPASAQILSGSGTATIDGVIDNEEWAGADAPIFVVDLPGGDIAGASLKVMNDATNLYLGLVVVYKDDLIDLSVYFDANDDGNAGGAGDDLIGFTTTSGAVRDLFFTAGSSSFDTTDGGTLDVVGATSTTSIATQIEISHPLDGGDAGHDIAVGPGDLLGFYAMIRLFPCCTDSFYPGPVGGIDAQIEIVPEPASGSAVALATLFGFARARRRGISRGEERGEIR